MPEDRPTDCGGGDGDGDGETVSSRLSLRKIVDSDSERVKHNLEFNVINVFHHYRLMFFGFFCCCCVAYSTV